MSSIKNKNLIERGSNVYHALEHVVLFPGSKAEYEEFVGHSVQIIDTRQREKYFRVELDFCYNEKYIEATEKLLNEGLEAVVNTRLVGLGGGGHSGLSLVTYGLPVRKVR